MCIVDMWLGGVTIVWENVAKMSRLCNGCGAGSDKLQACQPGGRLGEINCIK